MAFPTQEELQTNLDLIRSIMSKLQQMERQTRNAKQAKIGEVDLLQSQLDEIIANYQTAKAEAVALFGDLL